MFNNKQNNDAPFDEVSSTRAKVRTPEEEAELTGRKSNESQSNNKLRSTNHQRSSNKSSIILFWILFGILAAFDALMIIADSGKAFTIGSLILLGILLLLKKTITIGFIKTFVVFFVAYLATFVVFGATYVIVDSEISIESSVESNAVAEGFSRTVDAQTLAPLLKTTTFTQEDEVIYFSVLCYEIPENAELMVRWYLDGELAVEVGPEVFPEGLSNQYYTTMLEKGDNPLPVGNYQIEFVISKDGTELFKAIDSCEVVAK